MTEEDLNNGFYLKELKENGGKGMNITECNQNGCNWTPLSSNENLKYEDILVSFTAMRKLERRQFSTSSSFVKI